MSRNIEADKSYQLKQKKKRLEIKKEKYFNKVFEKYNGRYDYIDSIFVNGEIPFKVKCTKHNRSFSVKPRLHLHHGSGCEECYTENRSEAKKKNTKYFIEKSIEIHGNIFDYSETKYIHSEKNVSIKCIEHNHTFSQMARSHLQRNMGCELCSNRERGFNSNKSAVLYYLSINDGEAYKIGITNHSVQKRYSSKDLTKIKVINVVEYKHGIDALKEEQRILKKYKSKKYNKHDLLKSGNTELFSEDILELDNE